MSRGPSNDAPSAGRLLRYRVEYALFTVLVGGVVRLPEALLRRIGGRLARAGYRLDGRHRQVALDNLARAFPEFDARDREELARQSFANLASTLVETAIAARLDRDELLARFDCDGWEHLETAEAAAAGRGTLMMTAHLGNWEAAGQFLALRGRPVGMLARPMDNPLMDARTRRLRERFGNRSIPKRGGTRQILETLRGGGRVALLIDQRVHPNEGKAFRFFGHPAYTSPILASLSLRTGAPVVPFYGLPAETPGRFRVAIRPPIWPRGEGLEAIDRMTLTYLRTIEEEIRRRPGLWLWMHRRWRKNPTYHPKKRIPKTAAGPESTEVIG